jgi:tetraacyldisaccharide 4'-kinase
LDVVLADDGLQHQRLGRSFEIVVVDGERGFGNGACLPAGPLRDPVVRLRTVDAVVVNGGTWGDSSVFRAKLMPQRVYQLSGPLQRSLGDFRDTVVHAVAGIGNPERFFALLEAAKIRIIPHAFRDHARLQESDLAFEDEHPILMTEKDAVKCRAFPSDRYWVVAVTLEFDSGTGERLIRRVLSDL